MPGSRNILLQEILRMEFDETGRRAIRAGKPGCFRHSPVHHQVDIPGRRQDAAQHGSGPYFYAGELPEFVGRSERDAGNPQRATEIPCNERFVIGRNIQIERCLLPVAQKNGLDNANANLRVPYPPVQREWTGPGRSNILSAAGPKRKSPAACRWDYLL